MFTNPFGKFLDVCSKAASLSPLLSTCFAAFFLSFAWTLAWLGVFFVATWLFDMQTRAADFVNILWLSIAAESFIRWAENTNFIAAFSKPLEDSPTGDNQGFRLSRALVLSVAILAAMFSIDKVLESFGFKSDKYVFSGQNGVNSEEAVWSMVSGWWSLLFHEYVITFVVLGICMRAIIYKRPHTYLGKE